MKFNILKKFILQGPLTVRVSGNCMQAAIPRGSDIRLERRPVYWPGDIVAIGRGDGNIVSHRLLGYFPGRGGLLLIMRADSVGFADGPVSVRRVLGRVARVNGVLYRPGSGCRTRAVLGWFPAVFRCSLKFLAASAAPGRAGRVSRV
jgi:hypothetical protein